MYACVCVMLITVKYGMIALFLAIVCISMPWRAKMCVYIRVSIAGKTYEYRWMCIGEETSEDLFMTVKKKRSGRVKAERKFTLTCK